MEIDLWTVFFIVGMGSLLIERIFYYRSKYSKKNKKPENPTLGERMVKLETKIENIEGDILEIKNELWRLRDKK